MRERECGYCHEFHEPDRCQACGSFLRCRTTSEEPEPEIVDWPSGRPERYNWVRYTRVCPRCGDPNEFVCCEGVEVLTPEPVTA